VSSRQRSTLSFEGLPGLEIITVHLFDHTAQQALIAHSPHMPL